MKIIFIFIFIILLTLYIKWKLAATVLSAWLVENDLKEPTHEDIERITKWIVQKKLNNNRKY